MATRKPFSDARYEEVAIFFDLELNPDDPFEGWEDLIVPEVLLPSSVLTEICLRALQSNVSPGPPTGFKNEAATAAFLAGPFQTLVCLFGGILRDRPEQHISGTELSSGGRIEGEIFCQEKLLLFVKELKHDVKVKFAKALAQVLCELFAAWHFNRRYNKDVEDILPVRACLCDAVNAYFISYDGNRFTRHVAERPRAGASISDQVLVTLSNANYTFGILLEGYLHAVTMSEKRSVSRGKAGDKRKRGSERKVVVVKPPSMSSLDRESTEGWGEAVEWGGKSLSCFRRAHTVKSDNRAEEGLQLLFKSISAWPTSSKNPRLFPHKLKNLCADVIARHVQTLVADDPEPSWEPQMSEIGLPESEKSEPEAIRLHLFSSSLSR
ncbi:hypothetical protein B0H19DRAFT_563927 [Mycena capillaripes]|nr:hypothetical protein B0H19DRAFT_563927 [Mycena capillaripes]